MMEVCYSNTEEHQCWKCVIQIQRNISAGSVLLKNRGTAMMEVCYLKTEEQQ